MLQKVIFLFENNCLPIFVWIKKKRNLSLWKVQKDKKLNKEKIFCKHRYNKDIAYKYILFLHNGKLWNYLPEDCIWSKFHQNELNTCKNLNPVEVVVYDEYHVTISVVVMAFYLMVLYENLYFLAMEY